MTAPTDSAFNGSVAMMFPGQGSQFLGMTADLARESRTARRILERGDDILGYSLSRIMQSDQDDRLHHTVHTQPAIFVHSMVLLELLREHYPVTPIIATGHSVGEYSAQVAAGALDFDEALDIVRVRAEGMEDAQPRGTCGMAALIGLTRDEALAVVEARREGDVLEAVNFNAPDQVVVSGHLSAVDRVVEEVKKIKKARALVLGVSSAFHTRLMEPARQSLSKRLESVVLKRPQFAVVANINGEIYPFPEGWKDLMIDQIVSPVLWEDCVRRMIRAGADLFLEIGPGKVLTGLLRRIDRRARGVSISSLDDIRSLGGVLA